MQSHREVGFAGKKAREKTAIIIQLKSFLPSRKLFKWKKCSSPTNVSRLASTGGEWEAKALKNFCQQPEKLEIKAPPVEVVRERYGGAARSFAIVLGFCLLPRACCCRGDCVEEAPVGLDGKLFAVHPPQQLPKHHNFPPLFLFAFSISGPPNELFSFSSCSLKCSMCFIRLSVFFLLFLRMMFRVVLGRIIPVGLIVFTCDCVTGISPGPRVFKKHVCGFFILTFVLGNSPSCFVFVASSGSHTAHTLERRTSYAQSSESRTLAIHDDDLAFV